MSVCTRILNPKRIVAIRKRIMRWCNGRIPTNDEIDFVVDAYDQLFFDGQLETYFQETPNTFLYVSIDEFGDKGQRRYFGPTGESIDTQGLAGHSHVEHRGDDLVHCIFISRPMTRNLFNHGPIECSGGLECTSTLECFLFTLEHELIHLVLDTLCPNLKNGHGEDFMNRAMAIFGQTAPTHRLGTGCGAH